MLIAVIFLLTLALFLFWLANRQRNSTGLPGGKVIYSDMNGWQSVDKPFYDPMLGLTGKPDYVVKKRNELIPVEVKSSHVTDSPYDSHIYQLAAYCYLLECETGKRPQYGIIHYPMSTFQIEYTKELEIALLDIISDIRYQERRTVVNRSHDNPKRCERCGYQESCKQSLL